LARVRVSKAQVALYQQEQARVKPIFEKLAQDHLSGSLSLSDFKSRMQDELKRYYIRVALIAKGEREFTARDKEDLQKFLALIYSYLDGFVGDLRGYKALASDQGVISRASSYGVGWGVFSRYSIPGELADMLPHLPGISCMGNGDCGCILEFDRDENGYHVYWIVSAFKEHCPVCADLAVEWSPLTITYEEIIEEYGEDVLNEDGELIEF